MFLQFKNRYTTLHYDRHLIQSSLYSIRFLILMMGFIEYLILRNDSCQSGICIFKLAKVITLTVVSLAGTTNRARRLNDYARKIMIVNYLDFLIGLKHRAQ